MDTQNRRKLPLELTPGKDEALISFLIRTAHAHGLSIGDVLRMCDPQSTWNGAFAPQYLLNLPPTADRTRFAEVLGLYESQLRGLEAWPAIGPTKPKRPVYDAWARYGLMRQFSRACNQCLAENGGQWLKSWRLATVISCPAHWCLLSNRCTVCKNRFFSNSTPRATDAWDLKPDGATPIQLYAAVPASYQCTSWVDGDWCGADLREQTRTAKSPWTAWMTSWLLLDYPEKRSIWESRLLPVWQRLLEGLGANGDHAAQLRQSVTEVERAKWTARVFEVVMREFVDKDTLEILSTYGVMLLLDP